MNEDEKERLLKLFEDILCPKCPKCNHKLSLYPYYDDLGEIRICENCGEIIRKNEYKHIEKYKKRKKSEIYNC